MMAAAVAATLTSGTAWGEEKGSLFVNLTTDEPHRAMMALGFTRMQQKRGHPVTIFFNDRGVHLASKAKAGAFAEQQKLAAEIAGAGRALLVCPTCMKHYGVVEGDLMEGAKVNNPELTRAALFSKDERSHTW